MEKKSKAGKLVRHFTLIEMVVVVVILALLAGIATPLYFRHVRKAKISTAQTQIKLLEQAIFDYRLDMGKPPSSEDGLRSLVKNPNDNEKWDGPYLKNEPKDPWGNAYEYVNPGEHGEYDIICLGADGQAGGEDDDADIGNWVKEDNAE